MSDSPRKEFLHPLVVRDNGILLAQKIIASGFVPHVIYTLLRGGAPLANIVSECFRLHGVRAKVAGVVARSYEGAGERGGVEIEGWTLNPSALDPGAKVMLIDDIFDSGHTLGAVAGALLESGVRREDLKVVVHDYRASAENAGAPIQPDFYCRKIADGRWIHYLSHELVSLAPEELREHYPPEAYEAIENIKIKF